MIRATKRKQIFPKLIPQNLPKVVPSNECLIKTESNKLEISHNEIITIPNFDFNLKK